jgi:hypothetical protein
MPLRSARRATWSLLEIVRPGNSPEPLGILLVDDETGVLWLRLRDRAEFEDLEEQDSDFLAVLAPDLEGKARENGGHALLDSLEDSLSNFLRIGSRAAMAYSGDARNAVNRLFDEHVAREQTAPGQTAPGQTPAEQAGGEVRPFVTHLPLYGLRAAATRFGEEFDQSGMSEPESWVLAPPGLRLMDGMFVVQVVGRSMEPLIPDGSYCIFRGPVTGSRQGKRLLIEQTSGPGAADLANRYTVKRYTSTKKINPDGTWEHAGIRLEPLNPDFEAFDLGPDPGDFRVIGEFVQVLEH